MKPVILCILDGFGLSDKKKGNAILAAKTPNFDKLWKENSHSKLIASGEKVGLPSGQMGNSEVGHLNIGAGRVVKQPLTIISDSIKDGSFFENKKILNIINHVKENDSVLHIMGLISDGGVHSHIDHIKALLKCAKENEVKEVYIHAFLDGRDTAYNSAKTYLDDLSKTIKKLNIGKIVDISGRYYVMDRDTRWKRTELAYDVLVNNKGEKISSYASGIDKSYESEVYDEFIKPTIIFEGNIKDNDGIILANFRPDRVGQIMESLTNPKFNKFKTKEFKNLKIGSMFSINKNVLADVFYEEESMANCLGEYLANYGVSQLRLAETEKYAHVTYFFDGGKERIFDGCERIIVPSPDVATYDLKPEMSLPELTKILLSKIEEKKDFILVNFANCDMVGHTGNFNAAVKAVESVDLSLGKLIKKAEEKGYILMVTADHGNCEEMIDDDGNILTNHTTNLVPFIITENLKLKDGVLNDIAPTILELLKLGKPKEMKGESLIDN